MAKKLMKAQMGKIVKGVAKYAIPEQGIIKKTIKKAGDYDIDKTYKKYKNMDFSSQKYKDYQINPDLFKKAVTKTNPVSTAKKVAKTAGAAGAGAAAGYAAGSRKKMGGSTKSKKK